MASVVGQVTGLLETRPRLLYRRPIAGKHSSASFANIMMNERNTHQLTEGDAEHWLDDDDDERELTAAAHRPIGPRRLITVNRPDVRWWLTRTPSLPLSIPPSTSLTLPFSLSATFSLDPPSSLGIPVGSSFRRKSEGSQDIVFIVLSDAERSFSLAIRLV